VGVRDARDHTPFIRSGKDKLTNGQKSS